MGEVVLGTTLDGPRDHTPSCGPSNSPERVYRFEVPADGVVCLSTEGSDFDTILEVRTGSCDGPSAACSDDGVEGTPGVSRFSFLAQRERTYFVFIDGYEDASGRIRLSSRYGDCSGSRLPECDDAGDCPNNGVCDGGLCVSQPIVACEDDAGCDGQLCGPNGRCVDPNVCGNGILEGEEACDDGNLDVDDGCSNRCQNEVEPEEGDLRVVGGRSAKVGRVQIYLNGAWGNVCDDGWDLADADVACRQAGYIGAIRPIHEFGGGDGSFILSELDCLGDEERLDACRHPGIGRHICVGGEEAAVECFEMGGCRISDQCGPVGYAIYAISA